MRPTASAKHEQVRILSWTPVNTRKRNLFGVFEAEVNGELARFFLRHVRYHCEWHITRSPEHRALRRTSTADQALLGDLVRWASRIPEREFVAWPCGDQVDQSGHYPQTAYQCPWCAREHFHGIPMGPAALRTRSPHCRNPFRPQYVLGVGETGTGFRSKNWTFYHNGSKFIRGRTNPEWLRQVLAGTPVDFRPCSGMPTPMLKHGL